MKSRSLQLIAVLSLIFLGGCYHDGIHRPCTDATGPTTTETRATGDFTGIIQNMSSEVTISSGSVYEVTISAPENIIDRISTQTVNGDLVVDFDGCVNSSRRIVINVVTPTLSAITLNGSGDITMIDPFDNTGFAATINGSGRMLLMGTTTDQSIVINGSGSIQAFGLECDNANINVSGSGSSQVLVNDNLTVNISGSGSVFYKGSPTVSTSISGSGSVINSN